MKAIERIDIFLDQLAENGLPGEVRISDKKKTWEDNIMNLSFKVNKGFLGVIIKGKAVVEEDNVTIEMDLPAIVTKFTDEEAIKKFLHSESEKLLTQ